MSLWLTIALRIAALGALAMLLTALWTQRIDVIAILQNASPLLLLSASILLVAVFIIDATGWALILRKLGETRLSVRQACWIWMASSISRYLPGGIWPYASRIAMAHAAGVKTGTTALSLVVETILLAVSALAVSLPALFGLAGGPVSPLLAAAGIVLGLCALHPRALSLGARLPGRAGRMLSEIQPVPYWQMLFLFFYYVVFWFLFGAAFTVFAYSLGVAIAPVSATSAFALAFFLGFIAIFSPGGLGVREGVLYFLLAPQIGTAAALTLSVSSRLWMMGGELASLALTAFLARKSNQKTNVPFT